MSATDGGSATAGRIYTSQIGFAPGDDIFAVLGLPPGAPPPASFAIVAERGGAVFRGEAADIAAGDRSWHGSNRLGDTYVLSCRRWAPPRGVYRFVVDDLHSSPFRVDRGIYDVRHTHPLYYFRVQRSGVEMTWEALDGASGYHGPDHLDDARQGATGDPGGGEPELLQLPPVFPPGAHLPSSGGWFDAGDYNKYMGNTPWAVYNLLLSLEAHPEYWRQVDDDHDGIPDILADVHWALDWMLKMMHPEGFVYERVFNGYEAQFDGRPDLETDNLVGTSDDRPLDTDAWADVTAKSAYAMATAYRVFRTADAQAAARYLYMARRTWQWAFVNRKQVRAQRYGGGLYFGDVAINLALGAAELFRATGEDVYRRYAVATLAEHLRRGDWTDVSSWEYHPSLALQRCYDLADEGQQQQIIEQLARATRQRIASQQSNPYRLNTEWLFKSRRGPGFGQNDLAIASALDSLWLYGRTGERAFRDYAVNEVQWVWGRNPVGECWVSTRLAERYTKLHHTRVTAGHPLEGVVVPGASDRDDDGVPDYTDEGHWYYSEPSINQQAVYVRGLVELHFASGGGEEWGELPG